MADQSMNLATGATTLGDLGFFVPNARKIGPLRDVSVGSCVLTKALLLHRFERKSAREIARTLGVTAGASGLVVVVSSNRFQAASVGLAVTVAVTAKAAADSFLAFGRSGSIKG